MDGVAAPNKSTMIAGSKRFHEVASEAMDAKNEEKAREKSEAKKLKSRLMIKFLSKLMISFKPLNKNEIFLSFFFFFLPFLLSLLNF